MEANAKLYILKYDEIYDDHENDTNTTIFTANSADYGGAVYVDDDTNSSTCASDPKMECFFQVLALYSIEDSHLETQSMYFSQNHANISGSTLYGGLLDSCTVGQFAEVNYISLMLPLTKIIAIRAMENRILRILQLVIAHSYYHLYQSECAFVSIMSPIVPNKVTLRLKRDKYSQPQLLLLIRVAYLLMQPYKPPLASLKVV